LALSLPCLLSSSLPSAAAAAIVGSCAFLNSQLSITHCRFPSPDEVLKLFDLLLPPHEVSAAATPGGHICNIVIRRTTVILASSASPAAASATAAPMLRGHLPPQVAMTPAMMIPSPLASPCPGRRRRRRRRCRPCVAQGLGLRPPCCRSESCVRPGGWARGKGQKSKVPGRKHLRHCRPDAGSHGPGPAPVQGMACQPPASCGPDGRAVVTSLPPQARRRGHG
jgi:hypothetical protein